jgi:ATP-dependent protease HslVU (ClpYQ) peptidase subunit
VAGDGQVSLGQTVIKGTARKVRRLSPGGHPVVAGFCRVHGGCLRPAGAARGQA